jgi:hypothetical protein
MCTVTWLQDEEGYRLLTNRDERPTRLPGVAPRVDGNHVRYIAPLDGDHGGTWIGVNEFGLSACLLNGNAPSVAAVDPALFTTRGIVVPHVLECSTPEQVRTRIRELDLPQLRPFSVLVLAPDEDPLLIRWRGGQDLTESTEPVQVPLFSTAREPAIEARREHFASLLSAYGTVTPGLLHEFHASHVPERGPLSVCMHGDVANTVSFSRVTVTRESVELAYYPLSPCLCRVDLPGGCVVMPEFDGDEVIPHSGTAVTLQRRVLSRS